MKTLIDSKIFMMLILCSSIFFIKPVSAVIPAFLPHADTVPMNEPMAIDGVWKMVNNSNKKIRIEAGRMYAVDSWVHLLALNIEPGMVTVQNISASTPGNYSGDDLVLLAPMKAKLKPDGNITYSAGIFTTDLIPVELDYPELMAEELTRIGDGYNQSPPEVMPAPDQDPGTSNCSTWAIDPETNSPVCMD